MMIQIPSSRSTALIWAVLLLGSGWIWTSRVDTAASTTHAAPQSGFPAPALALPLLDGNGQQVRLSDYKGQPILLNFWATWCGPCRAEMPALQTVAQAYADQGLVVLLVNQGEDAAQVADYLQSVAVTQPTLLDQNHTASNTYRVRALPATFFIDRDGIIQDVTIGGPMAPAYIRSRVEPLVRAP